MSKSLKAVVYCRVSTDAQAEHGTSLAEQESRCLHKCVEIGAHVVAIHRDEGVSGELYITRPGIQAALADIESGRANVLVMAKVDRSGRDTEIIITIRKRVTRAGGKLVFTDGPNFEDNAMGNLGFNQTAVFAQFEREMIRERTTTGKVRKAKEGKVQPVRTFAPFGYYIVKKEDAVRGAYPGDVVGKYIVKPDEAEIVRSIFSGFASGESLRQVSVRLQNAHVPTPRTGKCWLATTIRSILDNPVYKGTATYGRRRRFVDEARYERGLKPAYNRSRPEEEWILVPAPAIVDEALWNDCQIRLKENKRLLGGNRTRTYLLSGLVRCGKCGRAMSGKRNQKQYTYYICRDYCPSCNTAGEVCNAVMYPTFLVESAVVKGINHVARQPESIAEAVASFYDQRRDTAAIADTSRIESELRTLENKAKAAAEAQVQAMVAGRSTEVYVRMLGELDERRKQLEKQLAAAAPRAYCPLEEEIRLESDLTAEALWALDRVLSSDELAVERKQAILANVVSQVRLTGNLEDGEVEVVLRSGQTVHKIVICWEG